MFEKLIHYHLFLLLISFLIATYIMLTKKNTKQHKVLGAIYMGLMLIAVIISLFISATIGPTLFNHFGVLHILSLFMLYIIPSAYIAAKNGNIKKHRNIMISLYVGTIVIAIVFSLTPTILLHEWIFGE
jgi:uncharacterized membrane protein